MFHAYASFDYYFATTTTTTISNGFIVRRKKKEFRNVSKLSFDLWNSHRSHHRSKTRIVQIDSTFRRLDETFHTCPPTN